MPATSMLLAHTTTGLQRDCVFRGVLVWCILLVTLAGQTFGEVVSDTKLGFSLQLPKEFVARPDLIGASPKIAHAFQYGAVHEGEIPIILFVETMNGTIGRERLRKEQMPATFQGDLFVTKWQGFEVDGFLIPESLEGTSTITYNIQIPLRRRAIQIKLFGPASRKEELDRLLTSILSGLKGESNWYSSMAPATLANSEHYGSILVGGLIVCMLIGLVGLWFISRRSPQGTVLVIAVVIYVIGLQLDGTRNRELMGLSGGMRLFGFAAGILGIIELIRKRKPKDVAAPPVVKEPSPLVDSL